VKSLPGTCLELAVAIRTIRKQMRSANALKLFAVVARHRNFRRAATELNLSTSTVSERIRAAWRSHNWKPAVDRDRAEPAQVSWPCACGHWRCDRHGRDAQRRACRHIAHRRAETCDSSLPPRSRRFPAFIRECGCRWWPTKHSSMWSAPASTLWREPSSGHGCGLAWNTSTIHPSGFACLFRQERWPATTDQLIAHQCFAQTFPGGETFRREFEKRG
jgi:hypothetical protein